MLNLLSTPPNFNNFSVVLKKLISVGDYIMFLGAGTISKNARVIVNELKNMK